MSNEKEQQIAKLRTLFEQGLLDEATYEAAVGGIKAADGEGSGVAHEGSTAVASRGINIGGNVGGPVVTGDFNVIGNIYYGSETENPEEALRIYRQVLLQRSAYLPLRGVDVGATDPATAKQLSLANMYITLNTTDRVSVGMADNEERPLTALEAAINHRWLVLTGVPGSGKTTFVNHLVYCLAANALQPDSGWLAHLPGWPAQEANLLPLVVKLRDFAASITEAQSVAAKPKDLWQYMSERLEDQNLGFVAKAIERELRQGQAILFLDGLDEVQGKKQRRFVRDAVTSFVTRYPRSRFLVTCRILAYQPPDSEDEPDLRLNLNDFPIYEIMPFDEGKIDRFVDAWYGELGRTGAVPAQDEERLAGRLKHALRRPDLWRLASTPLLLTVMTLVHAHEGWLPDARALLYERTVEMLLWRWEEVKSRGAEQRPTLRQLLLKAGRSDLDLKRLLWRLAYDAHGRSAAGNGHERLGDIAEAQLTRALEKLKREDWDWAHQMVEAMKLRAGLLLERAPGVFTFPHRTFQEYLAGAHLSTQPNCSSLAVDLGAAGEQWREAILLAAGRLVHVGGDVDRALLMVNRLCPAEEPQLESEWRNSWLAADALREIGVQRTLDDDWGQELLERAQERLAQLAGQGHLAPRERVAAGDTLAELGDPRPGVLTLEPELIPIPAGPFPMGDELHEITIAEPFAIGRTPVTTAQFRQFWEDGGYNDRWRRCWTPEGWAWREKQKMAGPLFLDRPGSDILNLPVTVVSWYESVAYTRWLGEKTGRPYRLPTEAEWERSARYTDGRTYPWGEDWPDSIANTKEIGLERPCAVGIFPADRSKDGLLDMAGNINEWVQTRWQDEEGQVYPLPYRADDGREDLQGDLNIWRVIKGGSYFDDKSGLPRCAYREDLPHHGYNSLGFRVVVCPWPSSGF